MRLFKGAPWLPLIVSLSLLGCTNSSLNDTNQESAPQPANAGPQWQSIFDQERLLQIEISIEDQDWNQLRFERHVITELFGSKCEQGLSESPYNYYPADVTIDGTPLNNVGLRTKGLLGSINPSRPSFKIKLQEYQDDLVFESEKRLTINNQNQDDSRVRTCLSYSLFAAANVPAPRCNFAHVRLNGDDFGVYANVEPIKKPFLARVFGDDDGNLYEGTAADIRAGDFMIRVEKKTNETEDDWSDIHQLRDAIEAPDLTFLSDLEAILNLDAFISFWAAEALIGHWDGFSGNRNNYYLYHNPADRKFYFIPWGADATFTVARGGFSSSEQGDPTTVMAAAKLTRRLWNDPDIRTRYQERMNQLLDNVWKEPELVAELDRFKVLIGDSIHPAHRDNFVANLGDVRHYLLNRKAQIQTEFANGIPEFSSEIESEFECMSKQGEVNINLSTTYGTAGAENAFLTGSGTMSGTIYGWELDIPAVGATAGIEPKSTDPSMASFSAVGFLSQNEFLIGSVNIPIWLVQPDTTVPINGKEVTAWFVRYKPQSGVNLLGFVGGKEITFAQAGTNEGDPISATLLLELWGGTPRDDESNPEERPEPEPENNSD